MEGRASLRGLKEVEEKKVRMNHKLCKMRAAMLIQLASMNPTLPNTRVSSREEARKRKEKKSIVRLYLLERSRYK